MIGKHMWRSFFECERMLGDGISLFYLIVFGMKNELAMSCGECFPFVFCYSACNLR